MKDLIIMNGNAITGTTFASDLFARFTAYTRVKDTTMKGYEVCLRHFVAWMHDNGITQPQREDIVRYANDLDHEISGRTGGTLSAGTRAQYLRAVKHFFKWTASEGLYPNVGDNIKGAKIKRDNSHKDPLQEGDVKAVLQSIDRRTTQGKRNYAIMMLAITAGLRICEMQTANVGDIKTVAGEMVLFIQGKGHDEKDDYKKIVPAVADALREYLLCRENVKKGDPLFTSTSNRAKDQRITEPGFSRLIKDVLKGAGYDSDRITAHSLRHTSVTMLLKAGATIQEAQAHARHADPATTEIYAHNIDKQNSHSEQMIYDHIFSEGITDQQKAQQLIASMNAAQAAAVLQFVQTLKGAAK